MKDLFRTNYQYPSEDLKLIKISLPMKMLVHITSIHIAQSSQIHLLNVRKSEIRISGYISKSLTGPKVNQNAFTIGNMYSGLPNY